MENLSEKENNGWTLKKIIIRVIGYLFFAFLIWHGCDTLASSPITLKDKLRGTGMIVAACVFLFSDIGMAIKKNNRPSR